MKQNPLPAIPARHSWLGAQFVYWLLVRYAVWQQFDRVWLKVAGALPTPEHGPLIVYLNHSSWWDGYVAAILHREVLRQRFTAYVMMDEQQLKQYRFFSWIGAFSVDRAHPRRAWASVQYIGRLLAERRDHSLWIFPQGELLPNDRRPIAVHAGTARIVRLAGGATLWPVVARFEFRNEQRPEVFIRAGPAHHVPTDYDEKTLTAEIQQRLTAAADALRDDVCNDTLDDYRELLRGRPGVNRVFDAAMTRLGLRRSAGG